LEGAQVVLDEPRAHQQVFRRVAREGELWKGDEIGAKLAGTLSVVDDLSGVAIEVADGGVDLGERDP
jgi:hypothetical protein